MNYLAYGMVVDSEIDFLELQRADAAPDLCISRGNVRSSDGSWLDIWRRDDGSPWTRVREVDGEYHIRYEDEADFLYSRRHATLTVDARNCAPLLLRHVLLDQVLPLVSSLDALTLHASAVAIDGTAAGFLGPAGSGKSTLAVLLAGDGNAILADDVLVVRSLGQVARAIPAYEGVRLCADIEELVCRRHSDRAVPDRLKACIRDGLRFAAHPMPLAHVFVLDETIVERPRFEPLSARDTAVALLEHSYRLEQRNGAIVTSEVQRACRVASAIRGWRFSYPRAADRWSDIAGAIRRHIDATELRRAASQ
jgi:adenylate kinase family enzyme